jgi:hypothetical protein
LAESAGNPGFFGDIVKSPQIGEAESLAEQAGKVNRFGPGTGMAKVQNTLHFDARPRASD